MKPSPPLPVYCHGLPGSAAEISKLVPKGVTSPTAIAPLDLDGFDRVLQNAHSDKAHLIGFSLGAMTALKIASQRPKQVSQITLIAPAAPLELGDFLPNMAGGAVFKTAKKGAIAFKLFTTFQSLGVTLAPKPIISTMFAGSPDADMDLLADSGFYDVILGGLKSSLGRDNRVYRDAVIAYVTPWADCLENISAPVTIYHGTLDNWAPIEMADVLQTGIPSDVSVVRLKGLGHYSALHKALPQILAAPDINL